MSDDLDADYARLTALGNKGLVAPKPAGSGVGRLAFLDDPNGARVDLIQRELPMRDEIVDHPIIKSFSDFTLSASDLDAPRKFYLAQIRMAELNVTGGQKGNPDYSTLTIGRDILELCKPSRRDQTDAKFHHFSLRVDNRADAMIYFSRHGIQPDPMSDLVRENTTFIRDLDGVKIRIVDDLNPHS